MELYHSTDADGISILNPDKQQMRVLLESLRDPENEEREHPDVSLIHDPTGWVVSVYPSGTVTLENLNDADEPPRFMRHVSQQDCLSIWLDLAEGRIAPLQARPWEGGA